MGDPTRDCCSFLPCGCQCCTTVQSDELAIVEHFGKFSHVQPAGLLCMPFPCMQKLAGTVSTRQMNLTLQVESKTKDDVFATTKLEIQYVVDRHEVHSAFYKLSNVSEQIKSYVADVVRSTMCTRLLDEIYNDRDILIRNVTDRLSVTMKSFGYLLVAVLVNEVMPAGKVFAAMNRIEQYKRLRTATVDQAEAEKNLIVKRAEAEAERKRLQGIGVSRQRQALLRGMEMNIHRFIGMRGAGGGTTSSPVTGSASPRGTEDAVVRKQQEKEKKHLLESKQHEIQRAEERKMSRNPSRNPSNAGSKDGNQAAGDPAADPASAPAGPAGGEAAANPPLPGQMAQVVGNPSAQSEEAPVDPVAQKKENLVKLVVELQKQQQQWMALQTQIQAMQTQYQQNRHAVEQEQDEEKKKDLVEQSNQLVQQVQSLQNQLAHLQQQNNALKMNQVAPAQQALLQAGVSQDEVMAIMQGKGGQNVGSAKKDDKKEDKKDDAKEEEDEFGGSAVLPYAREEIDKAQPSYLDGGREWRQRRPSLEWRLETMHVDALAVLNQPANLLRMPGDVGVADTNALFPKEAIVEGHEKNVEGIGLDLSFHHFVGVSTDFPFGLRFLLRFLS